VVAGRDDLVTQYANAVLAEISMSERRRPLGAIYFGGGTPTHVPPNVLGGLLDALVDHHGLEEGAEVSVEANPEDFTAERALALRSIGFNRVSFGAQSFDESVLVALGRRHDPEAITSSVEAARAAGFDNVSIDLIYGTPGETMRSWETTLTAGLASDPDHFSCYALTVEPGTPLGRSVRDGEPGPDPDLQADFFELADRTLGAAGYERYEVSNWSRPGMECLYNLAVWAQGEYEASGMGLIALSMGSDRATLVASIRTSPGLPNVTGRSRGLIRSRVGTGSWTASSSGCDEPSEWQPAPESTPSPGARRGAG
jgi:oxygen-independent coproporphyrinogen-3 oxidase